MKKIELSENCFGPDVLINDESLFIHEYDNRDPDMISEIKDKIIDGLKTIKDDLDISDWTHILEIIVEKDKRYEYDVDNSNDYDRCDQCGNWNHKYIYIKREDETKS